MAADEPVFFICPGKPGKLPHDCTPEAVAAIEYALEAPPDTWAVAPDVDIAEEEPPPKDAYKLSTLLNKLDEKLKGDAHLRVQVLCRNPDCATLSILTDTLIRDAEPVAGKATILLLVPTPGDLGLIEAGKGVTGLSALKAATANAAFVLGNLALITTLATALGFAKAEEIGTKLIKSGALVPLLVAIACGAAAIYFALSAQVVKTGQIRTANLEEVRALVNREVTWRAKEARRSIGFLTLAVLAIGGAFAWTAITENQKSTKPSGTLAVVPDTGTLDFTIETGWTGAPKDARLHVSAVGDDDVSLLSYEADVKEGAAELKRAAAATSLSGLVRVTSQLVKGDGDDGAGEPIDAAAKEACLRVQAVMLVEADCP